MTTKTKQYAHQCLAACGFAVMRSEVAWQLRPDLWGSAQECGVTFGRVDIEGAQRMTATLAGIGETPVLTRSTDRLAERIEWVTGIKVEKIEAEQSAGPVMCAQPFGGEAQRMAVDKLARMQALAAMEPPAHDCSLRREILRTREELGRMAA
jgi:hypothetical protein